MKPSKNQCHSIQDNSDFFYSSASEMLIPVGRITDKRTMKLSIGKKHYYFDQMVTPFNNDLSSSLVLNKFCMHFLLARSGLPVPQSTFLAKDEFSEEEINRALTHFKYPLTLKSLYAEQGSHLLCHVDNRAQLIQRLEHYFLEQEFIQIHEFKPSLLSYQILIFNHKMIGAILHQPAYVGGQIMLPNHAAGSNQGSTCQALNLKQIHTRNKRLFLEAARVCDLKLLALDVLCSDLSKPIKSTGGMLVNVNPAPDLRFYEQPDSGRPRKVAKKMLCHLMARHPIFYLGTQLKRIFRL